MAMISTSHGIMGWHATFDGYDGADDAGGHDGPNAVGSGETEIAAVRDLMTTAEEYTVLRVLRAWDEYQAKRDGDARLDIKAAGQRLQRLRESMELLRYLHSPGLALAARSIP